MLKFFAIALLVFGAAIPAFAQNKPAKVTSLICSLGEAQECLPFSGCKRVRPADINVSSMTVVDLEKKELTSMVDQGRKESIEGINETEQAIFLHGQQDERSWSASISKQSGIVAASVNAIGRSFALFGQCAPKS